MLYERFVRRRDGVEAARRVFARTRPLRLAASSDAAKSGGDGAAADATALVTPELYVAHAALELGANGAPDVAARVYATARARPPPRRAAVTSSSLGDEAEAPRDPLYSPRPCTNKVRSRPR